MPNQFENYGKYILEVSSDEMANILGLYTKYQLNTNSSSWKENITPEKYKQLVSGKEFDLSKKSQKFYYFLDKNPLNDIVDAMQRITDEMSEVRSGLLTPPKGL